MVPLTLDHLILAGPDLESLTAALAARAGVHAVGGGRHAGQGTHNALVGLGPGRYLELLAADPAGDGGGFRDWIAYLDAPALHGWCVRGEPALDADAFASRVAAAGLAPRRLAMTRTRPDGVRLAWELVFVDGHGFGSLVPFFIDWRGSPHPSAALAADLRDPRLLLRHPDAAGLDALLQALGGLPAEATVVAAPRPGLEATWTGARGADRWTGTGGG